MPSKTLCALPFQQLTVMNDGRTRLCCRTERDMTAEGECLSLHRATLSQIWNSAYIRLVRRRMLAGLEVEDCALCYATEAGGGTSLRQTSNAGFGWTEEGPGGGDVRAIDPGESQASWPSALLLWLGNQCNLKCRMCTPAFSSQVGGDPVQARWWGSPGPPGPSWSSDERLVVEEILGHPECLRLVQVSGGEPLLHRAFHGILGRLVDTGHASHIGLYVATNGTTYSPLTVALLAAFAWAELGVSVDGVGRLQEYIRFPARWADVAANVLAFRGSGTGLSIRPTVQCYNVFGLLDLARWCDRAGLRIAFDNVLWAPRFLSLDVLPAMVTDEALHEWRRYRDGECREDERWHVETVIAALQRPRPDPATLDCLQDDFMRFTNDLDRSRGQGLASACPRLHDRLTAAGFDFGGRHRFWPPDRDAGGQA